MTEYRNPFRIQSSEGIDTDELFLRLFSSEVLELLPKSNLWNRVVFFRSSPGGGKTSLFRLFTPNSLLLLHNSRIDDELKDLYNYLTSIDAIGEEGPKILGLMLSCNKNYDYLEDLDLDNIHKIRLLFSILDARLILIALRSISYLNRIKFPDELDKISFEFPEEICLSKDMPCEGTGKDLYEWAYKSERAVYDVIDSFDTSESASIKGHDTLISGFVLKPEHFSINEKKLTQDFIIMLDDCHKLTLNQRKELFNIVHQKPNIGIWISERREALTKKEIFLGALFEREYLVIDLEKSWTESKAKFEKNVKTVADKRVKYAAKFEMSSFSTCVNEFIEYDTWNKNIQNSIDKISTRINNIGKRVEKYDTWIKNIEKNNDPSLGNPLDIATKWRSLEILIERDLRKNQKTLADFNEKYIFQYDENELEKREDSSVKAAAEFFLSDEFKIPYYYGFHRLSLAASSNVEQFLWLSSNLFEEIISGRLLNKAYILNSKRQEEILKKTINERWNQLQYRVRYGKDVKKFLQSIGDFSKYITNKPNAPYAPGVTGIAILIKDREKLISDNFKRYNHLGNIISECIAHNLIEVKETRCKGKDWIILYLNRMLCVHFGLPLQYGSWREKTLDELCNWMEKGYNPK